MALLSRSFPRMLGARRGFLALVPLSLGSSGSTASAHGCWPRWAWLCHPPCVTRGSLGSAGRDSGTWEVALPHPRPCEGLGSAREAVWGQGTADPSVGSTAPWGQILAPSVSPVRVFAHICCPSSGASGDRRGQARDGSGPHCPVLPCSPAQGPHGPRVLQGQTWDRLQDKLHVKELGLCRGGNGGAVPCQPHGPHPFWRCWRG